MARHRGPVLAALLLLLAASIGATAQAQDQAPSAEAAGNGAGPPSPHSDGFWQRDVLTGDWGGRRSALEDAGILLGADSIDEILATVSGGVRRGAIYEGRLELLGTLNLEKLVGWPAATFHANAYQIRGRGLSANKLGNNLLVASNIEATRTMRLFDLWLEQILWNGALSLRLGQIAADDEFLASQYSSNFVNGTFGWPAIMAADLPSGGPAYPLATPGARLKFAVNDQIAIQAALFNGDPAGAGPGDPQQRDPSGTSFRIGDSALVLVEASLARNLDASAPDLPTAYKLGFWYHSGNFADQRFDAAGLSLAAPTSTGVAATRHGDWGGYAVIDQLLWRKPDSSDQGIGVFLRLAAAPGDRNQVALYGDAGLAFKGPFPDRGDDVVGVALAAARISQRARALDADARRFSGGMSPIRDGETALELTYRCQLSPWWALQPDVQLIRHPGAGAASPADPSGARRIGNAVSVGLRSSVIF